MSALAERRGAAGLEKLLWAVWQAGEERKTLEKWPFRGVCPQICLPTPAIVAGTVDKGRVAGTSPLLESYTHTQDIIRGALKYLTGREFKAEYPQRTRGNLAVGFHCAHIRKDGAALVDRLFREPTLDVRAVSGETIEYGVLEHCDALVISHPNKESFTRYIREFAERGGRIVAFGSEKDLKTIPADLPNVTACKSADAVRLALLEL